MRTIIEEGVAAGTYATPVPLQIFAYKTSQIMMVNMARQGYGKNTRLGGRITELLRIRSAELGGERQPAANRGSTTPFRTTTMWRASLRRATAES